MMWSIRAVRRDRTGRIFSPNRSAKIRRRQCSTSHTKRRVNTRRRISRPEQGRSDTYRAYLLCTRRDADPHNGHVAMLAFDLATNNIESDETLTLSATNPLGTRDEI